MKQRFFCVESGSGRRPLSGLLTLGLVLVVVGCASPTTVERATVGGAGAPTPSDARDSDPPVPVEFRGAAAGTAQDTDELMQELTLQEQQKKAASQAATREAEKLMGELDYSGAEKKLEQAMRLDPQNGKAQELLDRVLYILGDAGSQYRTLGPNEADRQRVRRQQEMLEMQRMLVDAQRHDEGGEFDQAVRTYDELLDRIRWYPYNNDLSDLKSRAEAGKRESDRRAQDQVRRERAELEGNIAKEKNFETDRSLRFVKNRIDRLMERIEAKYAQKEYEEVVRLADQVLVLDRQHSDAKRFRKQANELRHLYRTMKIADRHSEEWLLTFLQQRESGIAYSRIFNFPGRKEWEAIRQQSLGINSRLGDEQSVADQAIELKLQAPIDVEFTDQPFDEVITFLQSVSNANIVLTKEAREAVSEADEPVNLAAVKGLPLKNVLRLVLQPREFSYVIKNGAIVIGPKDSIREDTYLEFYEVSDLTKDQPDFKAPQLALDESDDGSGGSGAGSILDLGDDDEDTGTQIGIEVIVDLIDKTLWSDDGAPDGESVEGNGGKLVVRTTLANHQKVAELLDSLRKSTGVMVTVESRFLDLQDNFLQSLGIDFGNPFASNLPNPINDIDGQGTQISPGYEFVDAQGQTDVRAAVFNAFSQPLGSQVAPFQLSDRGGFALQYNVLDTFILEAILTANAKTQEFKKLDAPRVTAFNGQISHSLVIDQAAYIRDAEVNQTGVIPVINPVIGILNSGSILQVRPTVSYDRKYVMLEIEPTLAVQLPSRFKRLTLNLTNLDVEFPVLSVTKIKTTVTVPDGGTVLVGGLKRTITQNQQVGIPWTRHIPGANLLFGRKGESSMQSNLFVLINAKITVIRDEEQAQFN